MKSAIVLGTILLGFVLLVVSSIWGILFPATNSWTPEKAARISEIKARLNDLSFSLQSSTTRIHGGPDPGTLKAEYDALNKEFDQLKTEFESAVDAPRTVSNVLKWSGISLAVIGIIGWYAVKES
jgi:hypothetical protein